MTCKDCIHRAVCYRVGSVPINYADKCGDFIDDNTVMDVSVIEDIKAEIKALAKEYDYYADTNRKYGLWKALDIIDKHCGKEQE